MKSSASFASINEALHAAWHAQPALRSVQLEVVECTSSTNEVLLRQARQQAPTQPRVLIALEQSAGRGRYGRSWHAAAGSGLLMSLAVPLREPLRDGAVTLACGVAVAEALCARGVPVRLKWPNDLLLNDRKLAGLLAEVAFAGSMQNTPTHNTPTHTLVVGLGLNLRPTPMPSDRPSAALGSIALSPISLSEVIDIGATETALATWGTCMSVALLQSIEAVSHTGFAPWAARFNALLGWCERAVVALDAHTGATLAQGTVRGVDAQGRLLLDQQGQRLTLTNGDISLRRTPQEAP